jgi:hypothetical protein
VNRLNDYRSFSDGGGRDMLQRFFVKHNLSMQLSRGALRVEGYGRGGPLTLGHPYLLVGARLYEGGEWFCLACGPSFPTSGAARR